MTNYLYLYIYSEDGNPHKKRFKREIDHIHKELIEKEVA